MWQLVITVLGKLQFFLVFTVAQAQGIFIFNNQMAQLEIHAPNLNGPLNTFNSLLIDRQIPLKFLVHGYRQSTRDPLYAAITNNYVQRGDVSVITVDYPRIANLTYAECFFQLSSVESYVAEFIRYLNFIGVPSENMHMIGHSLGGQIVGRVGNTYHSISGGRKIGRISSLDPAKIGFESVLVAKEAKITRESATVVDILHTDTETIGVMEPTGTVDFYVNRGLAPQPGCDDSVKMRPLIENIPITDGWIVPMIGNDVCSHARSLQLFAQSILYRDSLIGRECSEWDLINKVCMSSGGGQAVYGEEMPMTANGIYYFNTTTSSPYANI